MKVFAIAPILDKLLGSFRKHFQVFDLVQIRSGLVGPARMREDAFGIFQKALGRALIFFTNFVGFQRFGAHHMYFVIHLYDLALN